MKQNKEYEENIPQVQRYFIEEKYSEGEINLFIDTLEKKLKELDIYISSADYIKSTDRYQIDEQQLYEQIIKRIYKMEIKILMKKVKKIQSIGILNLLL